MITIFKRFVQIFGEKVAVFVENQHDFGLQKLAVF
jgi:hypothetical protein